MSDLDVMLQSIRELRDSLVSQVAREVTGAVSILKDAVDQLAQVRAAPAPQWEAISMAMKTRHKSRAALLAAIKAGLIESRRTNSGGDKAGYLLSVADLDRHFPRVAKKARSSKKATA